jgi:hypothetical protein
MMPLEQRLEALEALGTVLDRGTASLHRAVAEAGIRNPWFTPDHCYRALHNIRHYYLDSQALRRWTSQYGLPDRPSYVHDVALVLAGNIPAVGFHDWLCVFVSGHRALLRFSEKDNVLLPWMLTWMASTFHGMDAHWLIVDQIRGFDAVIATGSDNSSRYFRAYFSHCPHIIRANRNGVAVLFGDESKEQLDALADDVFHYFGLGCRNVSHLFVPVGYDFTPLLEVLDQRASIRDIHRYNNNYDYQLALLLLNKADFHQTTSVLLKEDKGLISPVSTLHYSYYRDEEDLGHILRTNADAIQCIVSTEPIEGFQTLLPGQTQVPGLDDYADQVDTMAFLNQLHT